MDNTLNALKAWAAKLEDTIVDQAAKDYFLTLPKLWLGDVERGGVPGVQSMLRIIAMDLARTQDAVSKFGPTIQIRG